MITSSATKSMNVDTNATKREMQDRNVQAIAERVRERAKELNFSARSLGEALGIPSSTVANYWHGKRSWPSETLNDLAEVLRTNVFTLLTGKRGVNTLRSAEDAEFVDVPEYSTYEIDEFGKLEPITTTKMRRDWLYASLGDTTGIWMAQAPARNDALSIDAGTMLFCKDHAPGDRMIHGAHYLFRVNGGVIMARFALREDGTDEPTVFARDIGHDDDQYLAVARVIGEYARPL